MKNGMFLTTQEPSKNHLTAILFQKKSFEKIVTNSFKMAYLLKYKFSILCCFYEKDTQSCLTEEPHQNKPNNKTPYLFRFITTVEYKK